MGDALAILILALVILAIALIRIFNRIVALRVRVRNAWSDIDVQLKKRWDLLPQLVETVRGYATHEQRTLEEAMLARAAAQAPQSPAARGPAESRVGGAAHQLVALAEAYPTLRADELFRSLHHNLVTVEGHIESARRYYNAVVRDFNSAIEQFPGSIVAGLMGEREREFFQLDSPEEAQAPRIHLGGQPEEGTR